jgi:class 3 adenylate cyclase
VAAGFAVAGLSVDGAAWKLPPASGHHRGGVHAIGVMLAVVAVLPTGVVTFVLTDVVGSTNLWERAAAAMTVVLARHD